MAETRLERVRAALKQKELDGLLVTGRSNYAWTSGFTGSSGALLVGAERQILISDFRYRSQVGEQAPAWEFVEQAPGKGLMDLAAEQLETTGWRKVGFESDQIGYSAWARLRATSGWNEHRLVSVSGLVEGLREVKDEAELAKLRRAAGIGDQVMARALELARPGLTERQLKAELEYYLLTLGATKPSFDMILAGGPHSALCHAPITDRPLAAGDLLTLDLGALYDGYCSDLTRTVAIGHCSPEQEAIYELVYAAQIASLAAIRPGVKGQDVDAVARDLITAAGHGDHFGHGLGHGVGLDIHEGPRLAVTAEQDLVAGQIVTVEPGVYVEGFGGVRIEDLVLVTADGCESLSQAPKPATLQVI
ncbi:MAG: aminopeptidase P family protein [Fimbriimonadaceae bacterium]|nr:aminopeptidase P family protein [Fimbriimonadaceae bacterium]